MSTNFLFWKISMEALGAMVFIVPLRIELTTKWMIWRFVSQNQSLRQKSLQLFCNISVRAESMVAPPLFYIIAAEKDKIKNLKVSCFTRGNQVDPI